MNSKNKLRDVQSDSGLTVGHLAGVTIPRLGKRNVCEAKIQGSICTDREKMYAQYEALHDISKAE